MNNINTKYSINGLFLSENLTGVQRFATEICKELDKIVKHGEFEVVIPEGNFNIPSFENIIVKRLGKVGGTRAVWLHKTFSKYLRENKELVPVNLCNEKPFFTKPGLTVVHDVMMKVIPPSNSGLRRKLERLYSLALYSYIFKKDKIIATVSNYSKSDIEKYYPQSIGKVNVVYNAWQHVKDDAKNVDVARLSKEVQNITGNGEYFYSMSAFNKIKNGEWVIKTALNNPKSTFVISGLRNLPDGIEIPSNVKTIGRLTDDELICLMRNCRAFIFPSVYEGFGLPPLEAMALGAKVIISNKASLPEIFGHSAYYINPFKYDTNLDELLEQKVESNEEVLSRFSWEKSAEKLYDILNNNF